MKNLTWGNMLDLSDTSYNLGEIKLMPGTSASPAYRRIDVDTATGKVKGLF